MPFRPAYRGEVPTLGFHVLEWMADNLAAPDRSEFEPFAPTPEQAQFVLNFYSLDPRSGRRRRRRGVISRPKGWGKSPLLAAIAAAESLADVVPDGWDSEGRPVGRPWSSVRTPWVQLAAVSEDQTRNAWAPLLEMMREGPVMDNYLGLEPMETFVALPGKGRIEFVTSAATSREGNRPVFCVLDQTETWFPSNGGVRMAATMRRNLGKTDGSSIEAPNAYVPGEHSVAESSAEYWSLIQEGRAKDDGLLYDHREADGDTDLADRDSLLHGLKFVYGDSTWVDLDRIVAEVWDPATDVQDARRFYLNQITHASDSWVTQPEWAGLMDLSKVLAPSDAVVLGFDGSRGRVRGKADATALVGCRVSDGHLFEVRVWEQPDGAAGRDWLPSPVEVDAEVRACFARWNVVGFYADPSGWSEQVALWEAAYGRRLKVKAHASAPIAVWPRGKDSRVVEYVERLRLAIVAGECSHDGGGALTRHVLNARRRSTRSGFILYKEFPESPRKIDAAYAAVMAWKARIDALSAGVGRSGGSSGRVTVLT